MGLWWATTQFIISSVFIGNFFYFLTQHQKKMESHGEEPLCVSKVGINHPINVTMDTPSELIMDVGNMFFIIFCCGLTLNSFQMLQSLLMCFMSEAYNQCNMAFTVLVAVSHVVFLTVVTYLRYSHEGKVCSGDYLYKPITLET